MIYSHHPIRIAALAACSMLLLCDVAAAQEQRSSPGFLDNLFSRGEQPSQQRQERRPEQRQTAQGDPGDLAVRLDRMENALRQLTGTIEQLQYRNQQLEMQLQQLKGGAAVPGAVPNVGPGAPAGAPPPIRPGNRSDVFDPAQNPNAPGAPRTLGNQTAIAAPAPIMENEPPVGAPGGRAPGAPLDLSTLSSNAPAPPDGAMANAGPPQSPPRNVSAPDTQLATLPPTALPQDEYDLAYGYVVHKDYALAEQGFRDFLRKHPDERLVPDAQYWLGESLFQRQRYRDAAESFLAVSTKFEKSAKAPDALLRLGQSLAALNQKEAACATLAEVGRKFPRASASVKRGVTQEQKRANC
jgi:tol-pal system protein YbgF